MNALQTLRTAFYALLVAAPLFLVGCASDGAEEVGEDIDEGIEEVKDAGEDMGDEIEEAADEVEDEF